MSCCGGSGGVDSGVVRALSWCWGGNGGHGGCW